MSESGQSNGSERQGYPAVEVNGVTCSILCQRYQNLRLCLRLIADDEPYMCATVNVPDVALGDDEVLIKDWAENSGVLEALVDAGIVGDTRRTVPTRHVRANVVRLLIDPPAFSPGSDGEI